LWPRVDENPQISQMAQIVGKIYAICGLLMEKTLQTTPKTEGTVGYGELVRGNRAFRLLWFGQIISLLGDWFDLIASASLVAELTQSGLAVGGLFVVRMLAPFLMSPIAGVVADRYNRKRILVATLNENRSPI
jgi:hypothetical protein